MVLIQFGSMVVDRALYLKKTVVGKVIFQVALVFGIHFWMFFILPGVTERYFWPPSHMTHHSYMAHHSHLLLLATYKLSLI